MSEPALVSVVAVTYESERHITRCLDALRRQSYSPLEVLLIDNASDDGSAAICDASGFRFVRNETNRGFAAAHNQGIRLTRGEFYLAVNPDVVMAPSYVEELVRAADADPWVGSVTGKLVRPSGAPPDAPEPGVGPAILDSTGIYMVPCVRHLDRGSGEPDRGQYDRRQYVFGASGAAALYRRRMIEDVSIDGEFFDEDFFAYREDADVAWRAQLLGWRTLYTPHALATHERRVLPERRKSLPPAINLHSVKNRYLMRLKNQTLVDFLALLPFSLLRDAQILAYVSLFERSSLPGLFFVLRGLPRIWYKRRRIMEKKRVRSLEMLRWFRYRPVAFEAELGERLALAAAR